MKMLPLKYHGGKSYLAKQIVATMPPHLHYVETHFGGGRVLFSRDEDKDWYKGASDYKPVASMKGCSEVINDINSELMTFWRVLADKHTFNEFERIVMALPVSQQMFNFVRKGQKARKQVDVAVQVFIKYRQSRQALGKSFATMTVNRTRGRVNEQANAWWGAIEGLYDAHLRLRNVVIFCDDAINVIRMNDDKRTHFYCDPPYMMNTRLMRKDVYENEIDDRHHLLLLETLASIKGTFQLSGYRSELYEEFARECRWKTKEVVIDNKASGAKVKPKATEMIYRNY